LTGSTEAAGTQSSYRIRLYSPGEQQNTRQAEGRTPG